MGGVTAFLLGLGYVGMFLAALLAGSVLPFSSELVLTGLIVAGCSRWWLLLWAVIGNTLGSVLNYYIGRLGKTEWIERYAHVKPDKLERATRFVRRYGAWMGLLAWTPILGSAIAITLGFMRVDIKRTVAAFVVGKTVRYLFVIGIISLF